MKTPSMNLFDYLFWAATILEVITVIAGWDYLVLAIHSQVWLGGGDPEMQLFVSRLAPYLIAGSFFASLLLWAFISIFRIALFRYVLAICIGYEIWALLIDVMDPVLGVWFLVSGCVATGLKIAANVVVFREDAGAWLRREV